MGCHICVSSVTVLLVVSDVVDTDRQVLSWLKVKPSITLPASSDTADAVADTTADSSQVSNHHC